MSQQRSQPPEASNLLESLAAASDTASPAYMAVVELISAAAAVVAPTFDAARAREVDRAKAAAAGVPAPTKLMWCRNDPLNPCWHPEMPTTTPVQHWGSTSVACEYCRLRAAIHRIAASAADVLDGGHGRMVKAYIQGAGWCWVQDGEIIEVVENAGETGEAR